jgi:hypothetical protein
MSSNRVFTQSIVCSLAFPPSGEDIQERSPEFQDLFTHVLGTSAPTAWYNGMSICLPNAPLSAGDPFVGFLTCGGFIHGTLRGFTPTADPTVFDILVRIGSMATFANADGRWDTGGLYEVADVKVLTYPRNPNSFTFPVMDENDPQLDNVSQCEVYKNFVGLKRGIEATLDEHSTACKRAAKACIYGFPAGYI